MGTEYGQILTEDHCRLAGTWFAAQEPAVGITAVLCSEFGVPQTDYAAYAHFLSEQGVDALSFDYRGIGKSADALPADKLRLLDWGVKDIPAAVAYARRLRPDNRIVFMSHGLSALLCGLSSGDEAPRGMLCAVPVNGFYAGLGYMQRRRLWLSSRFLWPFMKPGGLPGAAARQPARVPNRLVKEWARWCLHPNAPMDSYGVSQQHRLQAWQRPIRCYCFVSDPDTPARTHAIATVYPRARVEIMRCWQKHPGKACGYASFFTDEANARLWEEALQWACRVAPPPQSDIIEV